MPATVGRSTGVNKNADPVFAFESGVATSSAKTCK